MMYLLMKRGLYYRPFSKGYTDNILEAGLYTENEVTFYRKNKIDPPVSIIPADPGVQALIEELIDTGKNMLVRIRMSEDEQ